VHPPTDFSFGVQWAKTLICNVQTDHIKFSHDYV